MKQIEMSFRNACMHCMQAQAQPIANSLGAKVVPNAKHALASYVVVHPILIF
jgi:hypothetical protein